MATHRKQESHDYDPKEPTPLTRLQFNLLICATFAFAFLVVFLVMAALGALAGYMAIQAHPL